MTVKSAFAPVNNIEMHYLDNQADGPILVLSHGLTANAHSFVGLAHALENHVRLIAVDLRGRGLSSKPETGYTMEDHAADILGLLDHLGLDEANIGGHSFGGLLTYHIASQHPDRVSRCVVMDAPAEVDENILDQIQPSLDRLGKSVPSWDAYLTAVKSQPYFEDWWDPQIEEYYGADVEVAEDGSVQARSHPEHIRQAVEGTLGVPWTEYLQKIECPVLIVRAKGPFGPPGSPPILDSDQASRMLDQIDQGSLVEIDGNHITFLFGDAVKQTAMEIRRFLAGDD